MGRPDGENLYLEFQTTNDDTTPYGASAVLTLGEKRGQVHAELRGDLMRIVDIAGTDPERSRTNPYDPGGYEPAQPGRATSLLAHITTTVVPTPTLS
ncbi:hypothetical protein [Mesorhizobium sp. L-8-3]|uniref:hypothetical protein n=1 Tax=Mesorhizobium sp. L-8-3 TaxID=2744522 RepID=UPI001928EEF2|nr:hypothetical protein [Mesorhizobium sp. L-8-3]BCH26597.1 hypothetical protein MesoLjLb_63820 [Mesorhizobium sp. L-8-3]